MYSIFSYIVGVAICFGCSFLLFCIFGWLTDGYKKIKTIYQWLLFFPVSFITAMIAALLIASSTHLVDPINKIISQAISWVVVPLVFLYCIGLTIPKLKKLVPFCIIVVWFVGDIFVIYIGSINIIATSMQMIAFLYYFYILKTTPEQELYKLQ